jgi:cobyrinic acid a,c-diamide synthase
MNAFVVGGTHSGVGKTTIALALMAFFSSKGIKVQPFKVGPDFIDPGLHSRVTGKVSRNLDGWMLSRAYNQMLFDRCCRVAEMAIIEGVMGLYDGFDGKSEDGSTAQMAKWLDVPVVLIVDAQSMARSVAAVVHGFTTFDPEVKWAGVILNRVGSREHFEYLREALSSAVPHIPILGWIPRERSLTLPERHLGLVTAHESPLDRTWIALAVELVERFIDVEALLSRTRNPRNNSGSVSPLESYGHELLQEQESENLPPNDPCVRIAVARDEAFCFYYEDNLDFLRASGADICFFSPVGGESIPNGIDAVILGGGYPEMHLERLSQNESFFADLRKCFSLGIPIYAECGGLMTLSQFIEDWDGKKWPMAGVLPFGTRMLKRRKALGYVEVKLSRDSILGPAGTCVRGHEFHYSEICNGEAHSANLETIYEVSRRKGDTVWQEGYRIGTVLASYVHQHWGSNPEIPRNFVSFLVRKRNAL